LHESIEESFLYHLYLGESLLPFRLLEPIEAIVPWIGGRLLSGSEEDLYLYPGLERWWRRAEKIWVNNRSNERMTFRARLDYQHGLSKQLPTAGLRVVYNKSGKYVSASIMTDSRAVVAQQLYWASVANLEEARFLAAILNSTMITLAIRPFQSRGEQSPRDIGKLPFRFLIPLYNAGDSAHRNLVFLAERAEQITADANLPKQEFTRIRNNVRRLLISDGVGAEIDAAVKALLA